MARPDFQAWGRVRLRWRRFIERQTFVRHPVSLTRQRVSTALLIVCVLGVGWYAYTTSDGVIRERAIEFLTEATSGEVEVERARFEMFGGITLHGVRISVPFCEELDASAVDQPSREIFSATSLKLVHNPWSLLLGGLRVEEIVATRPRIVLAQNVDTGIRNWQLLTGGGGRGSGAGGFRRRPKIVLRSATAEVVSIYNDGRHERRTEELDADVRPHPQLPTGFCIEVRRFGEQAERATVILDPGEGMVTNTPFVDARTVRLQLPKSAQAFFDRISLQGQVKLGRFIYDVQALENRHTTIELRDVRCDVPLSMVGSGVLAGEGERDAARDPAGDAIVMTMTDVEGRFNLDGRRLGVDISGLLNGARCRVTGHLTDVGSPLHEIGIDLNIHGRGLPAPDGRLRERLLTARGVPGGLRSFLNDYDPRGEFALDFRIVRPPGRSSKMVVTGELRPEGITARCRWFPYPVEDIRGVVRFDESGLVYIENVRGRHGAALIRANGRIDRNSPWAAVEVEVKGSAVPLDEELFEPLSERYKSLWKRFSPRGAANILVHIKRKGAGRDEPRPRWRTSVTADLVDAGLCFDAYPYPLEKVGGRLELEQNRITFIGLTGSRDGGTLRIDGHAVFGESARPDLELRIDAASLRLDETLAAALPPEGREVFAQFQPEGRVDLSGTVSLSEDRPGLAYDMHAKLRDATLCYKHFPYRIRGVTADVTIRPDGISVLSAVGRHGEAELTATGDVRRLDNGYVADLAFDCKQLAMDEALYDALPVSMRAAWQQLDPRGTVRARTRLHYVSENGQTWNRHRTEIEMFDGRFRFRGFPLVMSGVSAQVMVTDDRIEILRLEGRAGGGTIRMTGDIDIADPGKRGTFVFDGTDLTFSDELVSALPSRLRDLLAKIKAAGDFDLRLEPLCFDADASGFIKWDFAGNLTLRNARGDFGFDLREVTGLLSGHGSVERAGETTLDFRAELDRAVLAGWHMGDISARITRDATLDTVFVEDVSASLYGGEAVGFAEIDTSGDRTAYQMSVTARDVQLGRYLDVHRGGGELNKPRADTTQGSIDGNLVLRGETGQRSYREGVGEMCVREAQIWKLPIIFSIFQVLNLTPDENVFHDGRLEYSLHNDDLTFDQIDLRGRAVSLVGRGRMDIRTKRLDVTLLAGSPVQLHVPILSEILEGASRELMEIKVTGTLAQPRIAPQPLKSLTNALRTLFPDLTRPTERQPASGGSR